MSKITFRADDDLVQQLEEFDASKSEVMREALRQYLDEESGAERPFTSGSTDDSPESLEQLVAERVDQVLRERFDALVPEREPRDVNVNLTLDDQRPASVVGTKEADRSGSPDGAGAGRKTDADDAGGDAETRTCAQCGESVRRSHVHCPNCGEKASRRVFCDCGDELRSDWSFCPGCGRRTAAADVLDQS